MSPASATQRVIIRLINYTSHNLEIDSDSLLKAKGLAGEQHSRLERAKASMVELADPAWAEEHPSLATAGAPGSHSLVLAVHVRASTGSPTIDRDVRSIVELLKEVRDTTLSHASFAEAKRLIEVLPK